MLLHDARTHLPTAAIIDAVRSTADKPVLQLTIRLLELRTTTLPPLNDKLRKAGLPGGTM
jgi:hypothetical protein